MESVQSAVSNKKSTHLGGNMNRNGWGCAVGREGQRRPDNASGTEYNGPCRCGYGPHAYYRDAAGKVSHASQIPRTDVTNELATLKAERDALYRRISEIEQTQEETK